MSTSAPQANTLKALGLKDAAKALGISWRTLQNQALAGKVPSHKIGTRRVFNVAEILDATRVPVADSPPE